MESPVVLDKPPEYHGTDRGFPFGEEEGSDAWSELAARHPDIAARLRQRPATTTWARKRRPSSQDATDDFGENFGSFGDRFGFDDFPPEFREHLPSHWNRRFGSREEAPPQPPTAASPPSQPNQPHQSHQPHQQTAATQTDASPDEAAQTLPQYGLRNTVDLGQKSPADPSLVDAEERTHRSASAPPEAPPHDMSAPHPEPTPRADSGNVRVIPILVEGRDEPVINKAQHNQHSRPHAEPMSAFDRDQYFADDAGASFHHSPHFSRAFGAPNTKGFRQPPQPFQQKVYPQNAFPRGASPQRSQTPKPPAPAQEEHFVKVPVQQQHSAPPRATPPQQPPPPPAQREQTPPHVPPPPTSNDPKEQILRIQEDVLNLMDQVENFTGSKMGKTYLYLDEMLTRNLIKLDNIETEGKEKIRQARKDAIKCIQNCIAVLEAKAEKNGYADDRRPSDVDMKDVRSAEPTATENGEVKQEAPTTSEEAKPQMKPAQEADAAPQAAEPQHVPSENKPEEQSKDVKCDESKDKAPADSAEAAKDSDKLEATNLDVMQVDNKGDKTEQVMEVDGAASQ